MLKMRISPPCWELDILGITDSVLKKTKDVFIIRTTNSLSVVLSHHLNEDYVLDWDNVLILD